MTFETPNGIVIRGNISEGLASTCAGMASAYADMASEVKENGQYGQEMPEVDYQHVMEIMEEAEKLFPNDPNAQMGYMEKRGVPGKIAYELLDPLGIAGEPDPEGEFIRG